MCNFGGGVSGVFVTRARVSVFWFFLRRRGRSGRRAGWALCEGAKQDRTREWLVGGVGGDAQGCRAAVWSGIRGGAPRSKASDLDASTAPAGELLLLGTSEEPVRAVEAEKTKRPDAGS